MTTGPYELGTAPPARRALADRLPPEVAAPAVAFITGPLLDNPRRVGKPLGHELAGISSARLGRDWRVLYEIDDSRHVVIVLDIRPRTTAFLALIVAEARRSTNLALLRRFDSRQDGSRLTSREVTDALDHARAEREGLPGRSASTPR